MDNDATDQDAAFFVDFAPDGFFDAFGGFGEACQRGVPVGRPASLAAQEEVSVGGVHYGHYDGGVGAGEAEVGDAFAGYTGGAVISALLALWWR